MILLSPEVIIFMVPSIVEVMPGGPAPCVLCILSLKVYPFYCKDKD